MDRLTEILRSEVLKYAGTGRGANILLFPILDDERRIYAVNAVDYPARSESAGVVILARVAHDMIVIEEDATDKPLLDALIQQGVSRDQITLAYAGEAIPDAQAFELDV
jgi:hypothetical protein